MNAWRILGENAVNRHVEHYGNAVTRCESLVRVEMPLRLSRRCTCDIKFQIKSDIWKTNPVIQRQFQEFYNAVGHNSKTLIIENCAFSTIHIIRLWQKYWAQTNFIRIKTLNFYKLYYLTSVVHAQRGIRRDFRRAIRKRNIEVLGIHGQENV